MLFPGQACSTVSSPSISPPLTQPFLCWCRKGLLVAHSVHAIKPEETLPTGAIVLVQGPLCKLLCHPKATSGEGLLRRHLGSTWGPVYQQPSCPGRAVGMLGPPEALVQESTFCSWRSLMCATGLCKLISLFLECSLSGVPMPLPSPATYSALLMLGTRDC